MPEILLQGVWVGFVDEGGFTKLTWGNDSLPQLVFLLYMLNNGKLLFFA